MSEYTTDDILNMIEKLGGPSQLDLSEQKLGRSADLSNIDLSRETIQQKYKERGWPKDGKKPPWYSFFTPGAHLSRVKLQGAYLLGANLQGAYLEGAKLQGAYLREANLQGADLWEANLQGADLWGANLQGAHLNEADLREVDMEGDVSLEGTYFNRARLHLTRLQARQIGQVGEEGERDYRKGERDYKREAQSAYLGLKVNFREIGYYDDARWAYLKERAMERKSHPWHSPFWFLSWIENIFTGYMERMWVMILWLAIWPLLFAFL